MARRAGNFAEKAVRLFRLCLWIVLLPVAASAQHYPILPVANAPKNVFTLFEDSKSRLWMGTIDDVYCFDGVNFYSLRQYGYPRETPNAYAEDSEGGVWIASQGTDIAGGTRHGSLYRYHQGRVEKMLSGNALSVQAPAPGVVLAAMGDEASGKPTYGDLYRFRASQGRWSGEKLLAAATDHMTVDHGGNILFPCPGGWCELSSSAVTDDAPEAVQQQLKHHAGDPLSERVLRDRYGCVWNRAEARGSYQCPADARPTTLPYEISQIDGSAQLQESSDGSIFMLVPMTFGRPGKFHTLGSIGLPAGMNTAIIARDGTIWIGAQDGLFRFPYPFRLEYWPQPPGEASSPSFLRRFGDRIYTAYTNLAYLGPDRHTWNLIPGTSNFRRNADALVMTGGRILASSTDGLTLYQENSGKVLAHLASPNLNGRLERTNSGDIYLGLTGVQKILIQGNHITLHPEPVPSDAVLDMHYDSTRDILWACDGKQLVFLKDGAWHAITQADGLLDRECSTVAIRPDGQLWIAYSVPVYAFVGDPSSGHPTIKNFTSRLDLVEAYNSIVQLGVDGRDRLWLGDAGVRVATQDAARREAWIVLNQQDAMSQNASLRDSFLAEKDGSVWFDSSFGITHFSPPDDFATRFPAPHVSIAGFAVGGSLPQLADTLSRFPRTQEVTAELGSVQFDRRNALRYRYRLLPDQNEWRLSTNPALPLGRLSWGTHTLQVQAQLSTGPWSQVAEQTMTVLKPVWLTWPVLAGLAILGTGVALGGGRWRSRQRARSRKAFPELAELRLSALSPELQHLGGQLVGGRFEAGRILARGGFATVVEGRDLEQHGRSCAIKIFRQELIDKDWMTRRFRQEVLALSKIGHPSVVRIYGSGVLPGGAFYLVMEFIDGVTLRDILEIGKLSPPRAASYLRQVGSALEQIHAHGICHRDLKPENLMIRNDAELDESLVLIDFSIAIVKDPDETLHGLSRAAGTIYYMAPEQAIGYADASTDIYSLAKIVIEMLTGKRLSLLLPDASMDLPDRVRELLSTLGLPLSTPAIELLSSALEFDPIRRPKNAASFAERVAQDLDADPVVVHEMN